jgi:hypothetical protein
MDNPETLATLGTQDTRVLCLVYPVLSVSLDCPFWIAASVFYDVYLLPRVCPMSCVPSVASVSGLSVLDCRLGFL